MRSYLLALTAGALAFGAAIDSQLYPRRDGVKCSISEAKSHFIGGSGGKHFCESRWPSIDFIMGLSTWSQDNVITAIEVRYKKGAPMRYGGDTSGIPSGEMNLSPGERIVKAWMTGNGRATRLGSMHIETSGGVKLDFGSVDDNVKKYNIDVGSGYLIGIDGNYGDDIDGLSLLFLAGKVEEIELSNFRFKEDLTKYVPKLTPQSLRRTHYWNDDPQNEMEAEFGGESKHINEHSIEQSITTSFGKEVKMEATLGVPEIASYTMGMSISLETSQERKESDKFTHEISNDFKLAPTLSPNSGFNCEASYLAGTADLAYTVDVTLHFEEGSPMKYSEVGNLHSVLYSETDARCTPTSDDKAPSGFMKGKAVKSKGKDKPLNDPKPSTTSSAKGNAATPDLIKLVNGLTNGVADAVKGHI